MLVRMQGKRSPLTLEVEMLASTTTMENSVEVFKKTKNRTAI
jgi:hypothetical protein